MILIGILEESARYAVKWLVEKTPVKSLKDWATAFSLWPIHFTTSCCGSEIAAVYNPRFDTERMGSLPWVSPRQTNLLLIEGTLTKKMGRAAQIVYQQMASPRFVIAMGACAIDGGIFHNSYNIVRPTDLFPIDVYIPGCPPHPEAVARAIILLQRKVKEHKYRGYEYEY